MDSMSEQAAQAARASRGTHWRLNEKLSEGEIDLPGNLPIRLWIFTMQHGLLGPPRNFTTLSPKNKGQRKEQAGAGHR